MRKLTLAALALTLLAPASATAASWTDSTRPKASWTDAKQPKVSWTDSSPTASWTDARAKRLLRTTR
jgi:hypothetical protein